MDFRRFGVGEKTFGRCVFAGSAPPNGGSSGLFLSLYVIFSCLCILVVFASTCTRIANINPIFRVSSLPVFPSCEANRRRLKRN